MKLTPLKDEFKKLTSQEIVRGIAVRTIGGMWLSKQNREESILKAEKLTEDEATSLLSKFDDDRQSGYNFWDMFN